MGGYKAEILHRADYKTTEWSGGTTTELSIAPEGSIYADRDFEWRLSSATVDVEESEFTALPDYNRIIMTLKGGIRLAHNKGEWIDLPEFTAHSFDGGDETVSVGKVIDFNLMMRKGVCGGDVIPYVLKAGDVRQLHADLSAKPEAYNTVLVYCFGGAVTVTAEDGKTYRLEQGDSLKMAGSFARAVWTCKAETDASAVAAAVRSL